MRNPETKERVIVEVQDRERILCTIIFFALTNTCIEEKKEQRALYLCVAENKCTKTNGKKMREPIFMLQKNNVCSQKK